MKQLISILLSLFLGLFILSGVVSVVDDSMRLFLGLHFLMVISAILSALAFLFAVVVYGLMGLTPMVPKRIFLPLTLYYAASILVTIPAMIYCGGDWFRRGLQLDWVMSLCQVALGLGILFWIWGDLKFRRALIPEKYIGGRPFSGLNLILFVAANIVVALPVVAAYLFLCASLAVGHFTAGFLSLRPGGLVSRVRFYTRNDGKMVELVPMAHVADAGFYRKLSASFPTNAVVLMEGVTDENHLLTNGISYKRMAQTLGLSQQVEEFKPQAELVRADVDVDQFSTNTIDLLNLVMLIHVKGASPDTVMKLAQYSPPPNFEQQLFGDLIDKRNEHLLNVLQDELPQSGLIIVPWGAGHMPEFAKALEKDGFHLTGSKEYTVIRF
jgi:hypothetical protein